MKFILVMFSILVMSCVTTTKINTVNPDEIVITGASDELITYEGKGVKVTADRRGKQNIFQSLMGLIMIKGMQPGTEVAE